MAKAIYVIDRETAKEYSDAMKRRGYHTAIEKAIGQDGYYVIIGETDITSGEELPVTLREAMAVEETEARAQIHAPTAEESMAQHKEEAFKFEQAARERAATRERWAREDKDRGFKTEAASRERSGIEAGWAKKDKEAPMTARKEEIARRQDFAKYHPAGQAMKATEGLARYAVQDIQDSFKGQQGHTGHIKAGMKASIPSHTGLHPRIGSEGAIGVERPAISRINTAPNITTGGMFPGGKGFGSSPKGRFQFPYMKSQEEKEGEL